MNAYNVEIKTRSGGTMLCGVMATDERDAVRQLARLPIARMGAEVVSVTPVR